MQGHNKILLGEKNPSFFEAQLQCHVKHWKLICGLSKCSDAASARAHLIGRHTEGAV